MVVGAGRATKTIGPQQAARKQRLLPWTNSRVHTAESNEGVEIGIAVIVLNYIERCQRHISTSRSNSILSAGAVGQESVNALSHLLSLLS